MSPLKIFKIFRFHKMYTAQNKQLIELKYVMCGGMCAFAFADATTIAKRTIIKNL